MERTLRRLKNKSYPKRPLTAGEIIELFKKDKITEEYGFNLSHTERFYIDTIDVPGEYSFSLFASKEAMKLVEEHVAPDERNYLMDATFKICPFGCYYQLLIIYIEYRNDVSSEEEKTL